MEKVIGEFKIVETEDGYRIETKGDKGKMKEIFSRLRRRKRRHFHPFDFGLGGSFWARWAPGVAGGRRKRAQSSAEGE